MSQKQIEAMIERWMSDADFRARMRRQPSETALSEEFELSQEELAALRQIDFSQSDEELARQSSFGT